MVAALYFGSAFFIRYERKKLINPSQKICSFNSKKRWVLGGTEYSGSTKMHATLSRFLIVNKIFSCTIMYWSIHDENIRHFWLECYKMALNKIERKYNVMQTSHNNKSCCWINHEHITCKQINKHSVTFALWGMGTPGLTSLNGEDVVCSFIYAYEMMMYYSPRTLGRVSGCH